MGRLKVKSCSGCRWYTHLHSVCVNDASEHCADFVSEDDEACSYYYPINDNELFEVEDEDTNSLFD